MSGELPGFWTGSPRRVLVTGCAGFLGSTLCDRLLQLGHSVRGIDVFSDYYDPRLKRENLRSALTHPQFELLEADLNELELSPLVADREVVFHFAAQAGVRASWGSEFNIYLEANIQATQRLLEALLEVMRSGGELRRLVYSSSSSVYGNQPKYPVSEDMDKHPFSPYGVSKLAAEHLCELYASNHGLPASSLRYFTVYGPRQRPDMAFRKFLEAAQRGKPWVIYGDGEQSRDFTYVDDVIRANLLAALDPTPYGAYNIGGGSRVTLKEVLALLREKALTHGLADEVRLEHVDPVHGDVRHTAADGSRAAETLGFRAEVPLDEGLDRMAHWMSTRNPA